MDSGSNDVVVKTDEIQSSCNAIPTNARREQESFQECGYQNLSNSSGLEYGANSEAKLHRNCDNNEDRVKSTAMERSFMIIDKNSGTFVTELNDESELASSLVSKSDMKEFEQNSSDCNGNYDKHKTLDDQRGSIHGFDAKISSSLSAFEDDDDSPFDGHPVVSFGSQHEIVALYQGTSSKTSNFKKRSGSFASQINSPTQGQIPDHSSTSSNPFDLEAEELFPFFDDDDTPSSNSDGGLEFDVFDSQIQGNSQKSRTSSWSNTPFFDRPLLTDDDFYQGFHRSIKVTDIDSLFTQQNVSLDENEEEIEVFRSEVNEREKQDDKTMEDGTTNSEDELFNLFATEMTRNDKRTRNFERLTFSSNDSILVDVEEVITPEESPRENVNLNNLFLEDCANEDKIIPIVVNKKHNLFEDFLFQESVSTTERKDVECTHGLNFLDMSNDQTACVCQDSNERSELLDDTTTEGDTDISVNNLKMNGVDIITACHNDDDDKLYKTVDKDDEMIISNSDREEVVCVLQEDSSEMNAGGAAGRVSDDGGSIVGLEEIEVSCVVQVASSFNDSGDNDAVVCGETGSCVVQVDGKELHASSVAGSFNGGGSVSSSDVSAYNSAGSCYGNNDDTVGHEEAEVECVVIQVDDKEVTICNGDGSGDSVGVDSVGVDSVGVDSVECSGNTSGDHYGISNSVNNGKSVGSLIEDIDRGDGPSSCNGDFSRNNYVSDHTYGGKDFEDDDYGLSEEDDSGSTSFVVYPEIIVKALQSTDSTGAGDICQDIDTNNDSNDCQVGHHVEIPNESCGKSSFVDSVSGNGQCEDLQICVNDGYNLSDDDKINVTKSIDDVTRNKNDVITSEDDVTVVLDVNSINEDQREENLRDLHQANCHKTNDKNNDSCKDEFFEGGHNQDNQKSDVTDKLNDAVANCDVIIIIDSADQNDDTIICNDVDDKTILIEDDVSENVTEQNAIKLKSVFDLKSSEESTNSRRKSSGSDSDHLRMLKNMTVTDQLLKAHSHNSRTSEDPKASENSLGYLSDKNRTELSLDERILNVNRSIDWVRNVIMEMRTQDLTLKIQFDGLRQEIRNLQHEFEHYGVDCDYYKDDELLNLEYLDYKTDEQKTHINTNTALREDSGYHSDASSVSDSKDYGKGKVANVTKAKYLYEPIPSFPKVKTLTSSKCVFEIVL